MTFAADNLPEAARATDADMAQWFAVAPVRAAANQHAALVLDRLCTSRPGLREWLLNGTAPAFTDEPPEVTLEDAVFAEGAAERAPRNVGRIRAALEFDRERLWRRFRPSDFDPVRFELGKVHDDVWAEMVDVGLDAYKNGFDLPDSRAKQARAMRKVLARILPVAEPPKQWAELTDEQFKGAHRRAALAAAGRPADTPLNEALEYASEAFLKHFRAELAKILPVAETPRRVEVTPEVAEAYGAAFAKKIPIVMCSEPGYQGHNSDRIDGLRAAFEVANAQAGAKESAAVAEVARLRSENAAYETSLQANRDRIERLKGELEALRTHAAKLEAMLTVPGVDGPVKLWLPFEVLIAHDYWVQGRVEEGFIRYSGDNGGLSPWLAGLRQTPTPEAELKRWDVSVDFGGPSHVLTTKAMTRAEAEQIGEVIGEA